MVKTINNEVETPRKIIRSETKKQVVPQKDKTMPFEPVHTESKSVYFKLQSKK